MRRLITALPSAPHGSTLSRLSGVVLGPVLLGDQADVAHLGGEQLLSVAVAMSGAPMCAAFMARGYHHATPVLIKLL